MTVTAPYGSWDSPITPTMLTHAGVGLSEVAADGTELYWLESRPTEGGRSVIVRRAADGAVEDISPAGFNSRTRAHEYGGGAYAVGNGFDGALTLLGVLLGFYISADVHLPTVINACLGVSIALAVSGVSSAYISEAAEQHQALDALRGAMVSDMADSAHSDAARIAPLLVALANGSSPLLMGLLIMTPLWLSR